MLWHFNTKLGAHLLAEEWLCQEKLNVAVTGLNKRRREEKEKLLLGLWSRAWSRTGWEAVLTSAPASSFQSKATSAQVLIIKST